jgi:c-di-GMP-binding flagellar brake protein YcgR
MAEKEIDRRSRKRQTVRVPVAIHTKDGGLRADGYTRDLSSGGMFLYTKSKIAAGSKLEIVLILPEEFTQSDKRWVCCQASVVRVEIDGNGGNFGVAARIDGVQILPEIIP